MPSEHTFVEVTEEEVMDLVWHLTHFFESGSVPLNAQWLLNHNFFRPIATFEFEGVGQAPNTFEAWYWYAHYCVRDRFAGVKFELAKTLSELGFPPPFYSETSDGHAYEVLPPRNARHDMGIRGAIDDICVRSLLHFIIERSGEQSIENYLETNERRLNHSSQPA